MNPWESSMRRMSNTLSLTHGNTYLKIIFLQLCVRNADLHAAKYKEHGVFLIYSLKQSFDTLDAGHTVLFLILNIFTVFLLNCIKNKLKKLCPVSRPSL